MSVFEEYGAFNKKKKKKKTNKEFAAIFLKERQFVQMGSFLPVL